MFSCIFKKYLTDSCGWRDLFVRFLFYVSKASFLANTSIYFIVHLWMYYIC